MDTGAPDWAAACRRAARRVEGLLEASPTTVERAREIGRGEGGDMTVAIDASAEDAVFAELEQLAAAGHRFCAVSEERGEVDFGGTGTRVVVDPIDGSLNAKRGLPHHALSIAVAEGASAADVVFGYVYDFGPAEEWMATRGGGATLDGVALDPALPERRDRHGRLELLAIESADPRWVAQAIDDLHDAAHRLRAIGAIAISLCQVAAARVDGMVSLKAARSFDVAAAQLIVREAGGLVAFPGAADLHGGSARPRRALSRRRRPQRTDAGAVGPDPEAAGVVASFHGRLVPGPEARRLRRGQPGAGATGPRRPGRDGGRRRRPRRRLHAPDSDPADPAARADRPRRVGAGQSRRDAEAARSRAEQGARAGVRCSPAIRIVAGAAVTLEVGVLLGFMAQRVLGQYELVLLEPAEARDPRLLFVAPNLAEAVLAFDVPGEEFVRWVTLHEVTHAVQFAGVPWLQPHLAGLVETMLSAAELRLDRDGRSFSLPSADDVKEAFEHLRRGDVISLVTRPHERDTLDKVQATMAVVEGHAEHVMDAVGKDVLPSLPELRRAMEERRGSTSGVARILAKVLGLEMKLKQYAMGKAFCDAVVEAGGIERLNVVWEGPEKLPTARELEHPDQWLVRTAPKELDPAV